MGAEQVEREGEAESTCVCPFCDAVVEVSAPWCVTCQAEVQFCAVCEEPLPQDATECPSCGAEKDG
jgi:predicted amidophosphoribosyltransferase